MIVLEFHNYKWYQSRDFSLLANEEERSSLLVVLSFTIILDCGFYAINAEKFRSIFSTDLNNEKCLITKSI